MPETRFKTPVSLEHGFDHQTVPIRFVDKLLQAPKTADAGRRMLATNGRQFLASHATADLMVRQGRLKELQQIDFDVFKQNRRELTSILGSEKEYKKFMSDLILCLTPKRPA